MYIIYTQIHKFKIKTHTQSVPICCKHNFLCFLHYHILGKWSLCLCVYVCMCGLKDQKLIKSRSQHVGISVIPLEAPGEIPFLVLSSFWQPLAFLGLWIYHSNLYLCLDMAFSMCLCVYYHMDTCHWIQGPPETS